MVCMPYLIDGHNLIPKLGLQLDSPDDELELIAILQEFGRLARQRAEVYFDGAPAGEARTRRMGLVTAHFVRLGTTADSAIRDELRKLGTAARNWSLVSSDREVQEAARAVHATVLSSEEFASRLRARRELPNTRAGEKKLSQEEVVEWLKLFDKRK